MRGGWQQSVESAVKRGIDSRIAHEEMQKTAFAASNFTRPAKLNSLGLSFASSRPLCSRRKSRVTMDAVKHKFSSVEAVEWLKDPVTVSGKVQRGFGRGSRDLGTPTANLPGTLLEGVAEADRDGVYLGFGRVPKYGERVVKMVANLGRNITYDDVKERVLEAYLMSNDFEEEFYGEEMRLCIIGYMRPELKFDGIDELIAHINNDVKMADAALDLPKAQPYRMHTFLIRP